MHNAHEGPMHNAHAPDAVMVSWPQEDGLNAPPAKARSKSTTKSSTASSAKSAGVKNGAGKSTTKKTKPPNHKASKAPKQRKSATGETAATGGGNEAAIPLVRPSYSYAQLAALAIQHHKNHATVNLTLVCKPRVFV